MKRTYNLKKQITDSRDLTVNLNPHSSVALPPVIDLRKNCPPVFDQGQLGSCTANAGMGALAMLKKDFTTKSRLFQYYMERKIDGTVKTDAGAQMRDIGKVLAGNGACDESFFPYVEKTFNKNPSIAATQNALTDKIKSYHAVPDVNGIKQVLVLMQQPVLSGITVYESFESDAVAKNGIVPMPKKSENILGGHAILIVGYDDTKKWFICRNSWGSAWGDKGYFYLPYTFFTKGYASDFWVLQN